jgi:hypothetical protein
MEIVVMELWTAVRFTLYPVLLVCGVALALMFFRSYRRNRLPCQAWAGWLALATAALGLAGFCSLLLSRALGGFNATTSATLTVGLLAVVLVQVCAVVTLGRAAWREGERQ